MKRNDIRVMKMDCNNRSILMRALYADFCSNREAGRPNEHYAALIIKIHNTPPGKLPLNSAEFHLARNSLNNLRNARIAAGGYTEATDAALLKLVKSKRSFWLFG